MKNKTYYLGYENLTTGRFTFTSTNSNIKQFAESLQYFDFEDLTLSDLVTQLIHKMESNVGELDQDTQKLLLITMIVSYVNSGLEFGDENFYCFRTNGERFHTIGKKLPNNITVEDAEKFFKKNLKKDYDSLYQNW